MGVCEPDLVDLANELADAREALRRAVDISARLIGDAYLPDRGVVDPGWPAMECLCVALDLMHKQLESLPGEEIAKAIEAEREYQDEMSDRADGQSY
jgi:hypothetical protein